MADEGSGLAGLLTGRGGQRTDLLSDALQGGLSIASFLTQERNPRTARLLSAAGSGLGGIQRMQQLNRAFSVGAELFDRLGSPEIAQVLRTDPRAALMLAQSFGGDLGDLYEIERKRHEAAGTQTTLKDIFENTFPGLDLGDYTSEGQQAGIAEIARQVHAQGGVVDPNRVIRALGQRFDEPTRDVVDPRTGQNVIVPRSQSLGRRPAPRETRDVTLPAAEQTQIRKTVRENTDALATLNEFSDLVEAAPEADVTFIGRTKRTLANLGEVGPSLVGFIDDAARLVETDLDTSGATEEQVSEIREMAQRMRTPEADAAEALADALAIELARVSGQGRLSVETIRRFRRALPLGGITSKTALLDRVDAFRQNIQGRRARALQELEKFDLQAPPIGVPDRPARQQPRQTIQSNEDARARFNAIARQLHAENPNLGPQELQRRAMEMLREELGGQSP